MAEWGRQSRPDKAGQGVWTTSTGCRSSRSGGQTTIFIFIYSFFKLKLFYLQKIFLHFFD
jgi:hypothetical protein